MTRPRIERRVKEPPRFQRFKPVGIPARLLERIPLTLDEFEALRLADYKDLEHQKSAEEMGISRPTFTRLIDSARKKVAKAIVEGKEIFYDFFGKAKPNAAHFALAEMEEMGLLHAIITQNIDNLHQKAGSKEVYEFHGNSRNLVCTKCWLKFPVSEIGLDKLPPKCKECGGVLKPDFIFFGEPIPEPARTNSFMETKKADVFILIGTTGEIMPASIISYEAKNNNVKIIEVNTKPSNYTKSITDVFLEGKATEIIEELLGFLKEK